MTEVWLSLNDAAELEQVAYTTMWDRVHSGKVSQTEQKNITNNEYLIKSVPNPNGGHNLVQVALSSLSAGAQARYRRRLADRDRREAVKRRLEGKERPWYADIDIGWYLSTYKQEYMKKISLCSELEKYIKLKPQYRKCATEFLESFAREHLGVSAKQMYRYLQRYDEGCMWGRLAELEDGQGHEYFRILALCTPPKKGRHTRLTPEIAALIENLWAREEFHRNRQSVKMLYDEVCSRLRAKYEASTAEEGNADGAKEEWIPSYNTVRRYVDGLYANYSGAAALLKDGERQWKNTTMMKKRRDTGKLRVMELWQGDAHTFDCWIQIRKQNGTVAAIRPYLVAFIDTRSRCIAAWGICTQPNAEVIKKVIIHGIYPKECSPVQGVPRVMLIDNGRDFTAQTLTGRKRTERFDIDGEIRGFYKAMGIEYDMRALPYQAWTKGQMERFFGTLCEGFSKKFPSYTGTLTGSRTDARVKKDIQGMLERGELHTMDEFAAMFESYIEQYHERVHSGLTAQKEQNPRPARVYENAEKYDKPAPPLEYALSLLGTTVTRTVYTTGIELDKRQYMSEALAAYIGERVTVRVKDYDLRTVVCYTEDGHLIGNAYTYDKLNPIAEKDDEALSEHIKSQRRQLRTTRESISELRMPYDERIALPELTGKTSKTVAMVQDKQYSEAVAERTKSRTEPKKEPQELNDFMRSQAQKAIERIEGMKKLG